MKKGISRDAEKALRRFCTEKSNTAIINGEGTANVQMEIRRIADRIIEYALDFGTSFGVIEVIFSDVPWNDLEELYLSCPLTISFRNFQPKDKVDGHTLLMKHLIVVNNWSSNLKIYKASMNNDRVHLMLYTAVTETI